jgi:hypothetical protein
MEPEAVKKSFAKPEVIAVAAIAGYLLVSKKTRKPVATAAGAILLLGGIKSSGDGLGNAFARVMIPAGAALLWYGLRKKK